MNKFLAASALAVALIAGNALAATSHQDGTKIAAEATKKAPKKAKKAKGKKAKEKAAETAAPEGLEQVPSTNLYYKKQ